MRESETTDPMAKKQHSRVRARRPRGFADRSAADLLQEQRMLQTIRRVYESYGFEPVETPMFEYTDALGKFLPDSDRPNEGVFSLQDDDGEWLSLRYDLTAPLARFVAENFEDLPKPYRSYRVGTVFRNEKPGPGRFRQFTQFDADIVGAPNVSADAEMAMMMADTMEALGVPRGQYVIRMSNRKFWDLILSRAIPGGPESNNRRLMALRAIDKFDRLGFDGVAALLTRGRLDESGDFTPGVGLDRENADEVLVFFGGMRFGGGSLYSSHEREFGENASFLEMISSFKAAEWKETRLEFENIARMIHSSGYSDRISIDPAVVRGLEYYTGPVFEAELLFPVVNERGEKVVFGSVGGGGRYDGLVSRFMGQPVPATGFSIGVSRLQTALKNLGRLETAERLGPVVVTVMERERMADYQRMAAILRDALNPRNEAGEPLGDPVPVEVFQGNPKQFGKQLQYADRRNAPCVIIQGPDERAAGKVQVKDLALGRQLSEGVADNSEWRAMRAGQEVFDYTPGNPDGMIEAVRAILRRRAAPSR